MAYRIFLDAGVLITAFRGERHLRECALAILSEPLFEFWYNPLLHMEVTIQPTYHRKKLELQFYNEYFKGANCFGDLDRMFQIGSQEAIKHGISVVDALHIAAAHLAKCRILFTTEKSTKPMFRTTLLKVISIRDIIPAQAIPKLLTS